MSIYFTFVFHTQRQKYSTTVLVLNQKSIILSGKSLLIFLLLYLQLLNSYNDKLIPLPPELYLHHPSNIIQFS